MQICHGAACTHLHCYLTKLIICSSFSCSLVHSVLTLKKKKQAHDPLCHKNSSLHQTHFRLHTAEDGAALRINIITVTDLPFSSFPTFVARTERYAPK